MKCLFCVSISVCKWLCRCAHSKFIRITARFECENVKACNAANMWACSLQVEHASVYGTATVCMCAYMCDIHHHLWSCVWKAGPVVVVLCDMRLLSRGSINTFTVPGCKAAVDEVFWHGAPREFSPLSFHLRLSFSQFHPPSCLPLSASTPLHSLALTLSFPLGAGCSTTSQQLLTLCLAKIWKCFELVAWIWMKEQW